MEHLTIRMMVARAARFTKFTVDDILGPRRYRSLCAVRCAVYLVARERGYSYPQIGRSMGGRDHSTVINGVEQEHVYRRHFKKFDKLVEALRTGHCDEIMKFGARPGTFHGKFAHILTDECMEDVDLRMRTGETMLSIATSIGVTHSSLETARSDWTYRLQCARLTRLDNQLNRDM